MDPKQRYIQYRRQKAGAPSTRSVRVLGGRREKGEEERLGTDLDEQGSPKLGGLCLFRTRYHVPARSVDCASHSGSLKWGKPARQKVRSLSITRWSKKTRWFSWPVEQLGPQSLLYVTLIWVSCAPLSDNAHRSAHRQVVHKRPKPILRKALRVLITVLAVRTDCRFTLWEMRGLV